MDWNLIFLVFLSVSTTFGQGNELMTTVSSSNCSALIGLFELPCILPFDYNGKVHTKCGFLSDDTVLSACLVSKTKKMLGVCNKNCYDHGLVEPILDEEIAPILANVLTENDDPICGGVIISPKHVLISAHCIINQTDKLKNGKVGMKSFNNDIFLQSEHKIEKIVIHEDFNSATLENDLAIVFLKAHTKPSAFVQVAKLMVSSSVDFENEELKFSGWQPTKDDERNVYQQLPMEIEPTHVCKKILRAIGSGSFVGDRQICGNYLRPKKGNNNPCRDEKSGVLYIQRNNSYTLVGLLSSDEQNCQPYVPSVFVKVHQYIDWIDNQTAIFKLKDCSTKPFVKSNGSIACGILQAGQFDRSSAEELCREKNAALPDIRSQEENDFYMQHKQGNFMWLDLKRISTSSDDNSAFSSRGAPLTYSKWQRSHPRWYSYNSYCACLGEEAEWFEKRCNEFASVICEKTIQA